MDRTQVPLGSSGAADELVARIRRMRGEDLTRTVPWAMQCVRSAARAAPRLLGRRLLGTLVSQGAMSTSRGIGHTLLAWRLSASATACAKPDSMQDILSLCECSFVDPFFDRVSVGAMEWLRCKPKLPVAPRAACAHLHQCTVPLLVAGLGASEAKASPPHDTVVGNQMSSTSASTSLSLSSSLSPSASSGALTFSSLRRRILILCLDAAGCMHASFLDKAGRKCRAGVSAYMDARHTARCVSIGLAEEEKEKAAEASMRELLAGPMTQSLGLLRG